MAGLFQKPQVNMPSMPASVPSPTSTDPTVAAQTQDKMAAANREAQLSAQGKARNILTSPGGVPVDQDLSNIDQKKLSGV